jgi:hypothetical protein
VVKALAAAGLADQACQIASQAAARTPTACYWDPWNIGDPDYYRVKHAQALADIAQSLARAGRLDEAGQAAVQAQVTAEESSHPWRRAAALAAVAGTLAATGLDDQAQQAATQAEAAARTVTNLCEYSQALAAAAQALAAAGLHDQAHQAATQAEAAARSLLRHDNLVEYLAAVAEALAAAGRLDAARQAATKAEAAARTLGLPSLDPAAVARSLAAAGLHDQARLAAAKAEAVADTLTSTEGQAQAQAVAASPLPAIAEALTAAGRLHDAEKIARTLTEPDDQARMLVVIGQARAAAGEQTQADHLTAEAMSIESWMVPLRLHALPPTALESLMSLLFDEADDQQEDAAAPESSRVDRPETRAASQGSARRTSREPGL